MTNSWHAKQGQAVHPTTTTVSTGTQTQSTAAADAASSDRPHRTKLGHYYSGLCICVHMCIRETERDRGCECPRLYGWLPTSTVYEVVWLLCCIAGKFKHGEHTLRK